MSKILAQAGISLADVYDVAGSVAGVEQLLTQEVSLVHEMGGQMFSERLGAFILEIPNGGIAQSTGWVVDTVILPDTTHRILGVTMLSDSAAEVGTATLAVANTASDREIPIWSWDSTIDDEVITRWSNDGAAVANMLLLRSVAPQQVPYMLIREGIEKQMPHLIFRGSTLGFGAGTNDTFCLIHIARAGDADPQPGNPSSHGLPIPSW